jgi:hypothetical protein
MRLRAGVGGLWLAAICAMTLGLFVAPAQASRTLITTEAIRPDPNPLDPAPPPDGQVEGACGVANAGGSLYLSEYYRHRVDVFVGSTFSSQIAAPNSLDGVCGLAFASNRLYANEWHEGVVRLLPSLQTFDTGHESTGVAVDAAGNVYASDRTYVAVYEPSGAVLLREGQPLEIGLDHLGDAYGIAVSGPRVYVADAASQSVKVFEPAVDPSVPVATIGFNFTSLVDGALAVDPTNGHLLVLDNLQPGWESPEAAVDEFDSSGAFVGQITAGIIDGEPSGLTVDSGGNLFVTSGNSEGSKVFKFGPYFDGLAALASAAPRASAAATTASGASAEPTPTPDPRSPLPVASASEVVQQGRVRVALQAKLTPKRLPRSGTAPVHFSISAKIGSTDGSVPPQLRSLVIEINRHGHIDPAALPVCQVDQIQPATTEGALEACGRSVVGKGTFSAKVLITQQTPFPSAGEVVAFNGRWNGRPAILAHIYGTQPVPTSYTLPFVIKTVSRGAYGTVLKASLPQFTGKWGYVTGIGLDLGRSTSRRGGGRGYLTAGCPVPKGFGSASFPLARTSLSFGRGGPKTVDQTLIRTCGAR